MATHSSILAWGVLWAEEPGGLPMCRVAHDWSNLACMHALEKEMATHSSILAWRIPATGEPGGLPSMGSYRVRHDWSDLAAAAGVKNWRKLEENIELFVLEAPVWNAIFFLRKRRGNTQQLHLVNEADPGSSWNSLWCILPRNAVPNKEGLSPVCSRGTCWRWYLGGTGCNFEKIVACCKRHIFRDGRRPANRIREDEWRGREYKELSYEPFHRLPWNCPFVFCRQPTKALLASLEIDC